MKKEISLNSYISQLKIISMKALRICLIIMFLFPGCRSEDIPVVTTFEATSVTQTSATCGGEVISQGDAEVTSRGIYLGTSGDQAIIDTVTVNTTGTGSFTSELTNLEPGTDYYVNSYAANCYGTGYGNSKTFTTEAAIPPVINTSGITNITCSTATSGGKIISDGAVQIIDRGLCWGPSENPTIEDNFISLENVYKLNPFSYTIKDLEANSTYYVRAYATNIVGTSYGECRQFTTNNPDAQSEPNSIIGTWEMYYSCGGISGCDDAILGTTHITELSKDSLIIDRYMGEILLECNFTVSGDTIRYLYGVADPAIYNLNPTFDTLSFYYPSNGFRTYYARLY